VGLSTFKGTITARTTTGSQAYTGVGFTPKIVLFWWGLQTAEGTTAPAGTGFGVACNPSGVTFQQWAVSYAADNAAASSNEGASTSTAACIDILSVGSGAAGGHTGTAAVTAMGSDGFTLNWTDAATSAWIIHYLAIGGTDITACAAGSFNSPATVGASSQDVTSLSFQPSTLLIANHQGNAGNRTGGGVNLGVATGASEQWAYGFNGTDAAADAALGGAFDAANIVAAPSAAGTTSPGTWNWRGALDSFLSNGFRIAWSQNAAARPMLYLAVAGMRAKAGSDSTRTTTGDQDTTGPGFTPKAVLLAGMGQASGTSYPDLTSTELLTNIVGGFDDGGREGAVCTNNDDAAATMATRTRTSTSKAYVEQNHAGTVTVDADGSMVGTGFRLSYTTVKATASAFGYLALGQQGTEYTDARSIGLGLGLSRTESYERIFTDARSVGLRLTLTRTESYERIWTDARSVALGLALSRAEALELAQARSIALALGASRTEANERDTARSIPLGLGLSGVDSYTAPIIYTDARAIALGVALTRAEANERATERAIALALTATRTEANERDTAGAVPAELELTRADELEHVGTGALALELGLSATEEWQHDTEYVDAGELPLELGLSGTDALEHVGTGTGPELELALGSSESSERDAEGQAPLELTLAAQEAAEHVGEAILPLSLGVSGEGAPLEHSDAGALPLELAGSSVEDHTAEQARAIGLILGLSGFREGEQVWTDERAIPLELALPAGVEDHDAAQARDLPAELGLSGTDAYEPPGAERAIPLELELAGTDAHETAHARAVPLELGLSGVEEHSGATIYTDAGAISLELAGSGTDALERAGDRRLEPELGLSRQEALEHTGAGAGPELELTIPPSTDVLEHARTIGLPLRLAGSRLEAHEHERAADLLLELALSSTRPPDLIDARLTLETAGAEATLSSAAGAVSLSASAAAVALEDRPGAELELETVNPGEA
jgi:hypothetical protein